MIPLGNINLAASFVSKSQRARVITEAWVAEHTYCVACSSEKILPTSPNTKSRDFECAQCSHAYELKSSSSRFGQKIVDGAYASMINRIREGSTPNLLLLQYGTNWEIQNLSVVHHLLITETVIQQRPPLSVSARRAGWIGCNILIGEIPLEGRIPVIEQGLYLPQSDVRHRFSLSEKLSVVSPIGRGWAAAVLTELRRLGMNRFTTQDAYAAEAKLSVKYPHNRNVRAKIRQQLQVLRDLGFLQFEARGVYSFTVRK